MLKRRNLKPVVDLRKSVGDGISLVNLIEILGKSKF